MGFSFLAGLQMLYDAAHHNNDSTEAVPCVENVDNYLLYQYSLIPSIALCCLFGVSITRRHMFLSKLKGRPGLIYPMDTLTRDHSLSYACAFGATGYVVYQILADGQFAIQYTGPLSLKSLIAIVSMFIYGIVYFPVFASLALGTAVSYGLGAAYIWMFFIIDIYRLTDCHFSAKLRLVGVLQDMPNIFCLAYLGISLPIRCAMAVRRRTYFYSPIDHLKQETVKDVQESFHGIHVRELFRKPVRKPLPVGKAEKVKSTIKHLIHRFIYHRKRGFKYPSLLVSVLFVAGCVIYMTTVQFYAYVTNLLDIILDSAQNKLDEIHWHDQPGDSLPLIIERELYTYFYNVFYAIKVSSIVSTTVASLVSLLTILHTMTSFRENGTYGRSEIIFWDSELFHKKNLNYLRKDGFLAILVDSGNFAWALAPTRKNLFALYRGDFKTIPPASDSSAASLCIGSMKFAGYQVAYMFWGYLMTYVVLFVVCLILALIIALLIVGETAWLVDYVLQLWPGFLIGLGVYIAQQIVARLVFLQDNGKHLRLNNRRAYFVFIYFMFFFNIFLGLVSCLLRIGKAIFIGVFGLARLDNSTLPRSFEFFDPGFSAYRGFIHMEAAHTNPVVNVFIRLLVSMTKNKKGSRNGANNAGPYSLRQRASGGYDVKFQYRLCTLHWFLSWKRRSRSRHHSPCREDTSGVKRSRRLKDAARYNWLVTYTLLNNPTIRVYRKGYIQALRKAREEGIKIPISDKLFTDFDLVKSREQKEKEKLEELERIQSAKRHSPHERDCSEPSVIRAVVLEDVVTDGMLGRGHRHTSTVL